MTYMCGLKFYCYRTPKYKFTNNLYREDLVDQNQINVLLTSNVNNDIKRFKFGLKPGVFAVIFRSIA